MMNTKTKYIMLFLTIAVAVSLIMPIPAYSAVSDSSDRLSNDQAGVFSPGYINATRQRTNEIINQSSKPKSFMENAIEYVKSRLGNDVGEDAANKVTPELKKKTSGTGENTTKAIAAAESFTVSSLVDSTKYNVDIGSGKNKEYFKTQAVIARTYMYKFFDKHLPDRYNVCDNTHCQAFNGSSSDTLINSAALETKGLVILDKDSTLIISAFHSNCGGETSSSEDVWLTSQTYLKSVVDPYCLSSKNAVRRVSFNLKDWFEFIKKSGYNGSADDPADLNFIQKSRSVDYKTGSFTMPLRTIRTDMNLRSTFFSVVSEGDSVILKGKGYGHGIGLCQEGAMAMAENGFNYLQIIDFYYFGVLIADIKNAVILPPNPPFGGL